MSSSSSPWDAGYGTGFGSGSPAGVTVVGWPTVTDVENWLRTVGQPAAEQTVTGQALSASIDWVTMRADPQWTTPGLPGFLPAGLFQAALLDACRGYRRRDSVDGTVGWGDMGIVRVGPKDPEVEKYLAPYVAVVFG
jgi:hypothetical protein